VLLALLTLIQIILFKSLTLTFSTGIFVLFWPILGLWSYEILYKFSPFFGLKDKRGPLHKVIHVEWLFILAFDLCVIYWHQLGNPIWVWGLLYAFFQIALGSILIINLKRNLIHKTCDDLRQILFFILFVSVLTSVQWGGWFVLRSNPSGGLEFQFWAIGFPVLALLGTILSVHLFFLAYLVHRIYEKTLITWVMCIWNPFLFPILVF